MKNVSFVYYFKTLSLTCYRCLDHFDAISHTSNFLSTKNSLPHYKSSCAENVPIIGKHSTLDYQTTKFVHVICHRIISFWGEKVLENNR